VQFRNLKKDKYVFHYFVDKDGVLTMKGWNLQEQSEELFLLMHL
jgi:hypothetical protein